MKIIHFLFFILIPHFLFGQTNHFSITIKNKTSKDLKIEIDSNLPHCPSMYGTGNQFLNPLFYQSTDSTTVLADNSVTTLLSCDFEGISKSRIKDYLKASEYGRWELENHWSAVLKIKEDGISLKVRKRGIKYILVYK